jgi:hypothetical protein
VFTVESINPVLLEIKSVSLKMKFGSKFMLLCSLITLAKVESLLYTNDVLKAKSQTPFGRPAFSWTLWGV